MKSFFSKQGPLLVDTADNPASAAVGAVIDVAGGLIGIFIPPSRPSK